MNRILIAISVWVLGFATANHAAAVDLTTIERSIAKFPELRSKSPGYCLLVFGPEAAKHVWLVHDDDVLYVDRNGNGDLTEPGERVEADAKLSKPAERIFNFLAGDIPDGDVPHRNLRVRHSKLTSLRTSAAGKAILANSDSLRVYVLDLDVAITGLRGSGQEGCVPHWVPMVKFAAKPESAPIIHFGGPLEITLNGNEPLRAGRVNEVQLFYGTRGLGPGTFAAAAYQNVIPVTASPVAKLTLPKSSSGSSESELSFELTKRCCTFSLYGDVRVPGDAPTGKAKLQLSLDALPAVYIAPTEHEVTILPPRPGPPLAPVSPRLVGKLEHAHRDGTICAIEFSPDGKRLIAGDYPGGLVHVWDLASGRPSATFDLGSGFRPSVQFFSVPRDWQTVVAPRQGRGVFQKLDRDGKKLTRATYDDLVRIFDLSSGSELRTLQMSPANGIRALTLSPDGSYCLTCDDVPAEFETRRPRQLTYWNLATGDHQLVATGNANVCAVSSDGKLFAVTMPADGDTYSSSIKIFSAPDLRETCTIALPEHAIASAGVFSPDGRTLAAPMHEFDQQGNFKNFRCHLKCWDIATSKETLSYSAPHKQDALGYPRFSPAGRTIAFANVSAGDKGGSVVLIELATQVAKVVELEPETFVRPFAFSKDGSWLAVPAQVLARREGTVRDPSPDDLPQPKIHCIDVADGRVLETLICPQAWLASTVFSPDGNTLATSGKGEVLLWDFRSPPGSETPKQASVQGR